MCFLRLYILEQFCFFFKFVEREREAGSSARFLCSFSFHQQLMATSADMVLLYNTYNLDVCQGVGMFKKRDV